MHFCYLQKIQTSQRYSNAEGWNWWGACLVTDLVDSKVKSCVQLPENYAQPLSIYV